MFSFLLEIENNNKNIFDWIFENIFNKKFSQTNQKIKTIKFYFQLKIQISFLVK